MLGICPRSFKTPMISYNLAFLIIVYCSRAQISSVINFVLLYREDNRVLRKEVIFSSNNISSVLFTTYYLIISFVQFLIVEL